VHSARTSSAERDLIKAIGARHPFLLAYQGENDRAKRSQRPGGGFGLLVADGAKVTTGDVKTLPVELARPHHQPDRRATLFATAATP
jgi:hypothetical protein